MDWERCRPDFEADGSLRDIYVLATTTREWDVALAVVRDHATSVAFSIDAEGRPLPPSASEIFAVSRDRSALLTFKYAAIPLSCHFFGEDEIELSLAPNDISSPDRLDALVEFLSILGTRIGRDVLLTPENLPAGQRFGKRMGNELAPLRWRRRSTALSRRGDEVLGLLRSCEFS